MTTRSDHHWSNRHRRVESPSIAAGTRGIALRHHPDRAKRSTQPQCQSGFPAGSKRKLEFEYYWQGRRIRKVSHSAWNGSSYATVATTKFIYDGWNLLAELDSSSNVIRSHVWGADLSGTMQGAGGVGGLLMVKESDGTPHFAAHDGNGNVAGLVKGADGTRTATYEYDPFGQPLRATGTLALANPMRFSTKFTDSETGLLYYGYRYYSPSLGRWVNRDPIGEKGGVNLRGFVANDPMDAFDPLGLDVSAPFRQMQMCKNLQNSLNTSANNQVKDALAEYIKGGAKKISCGPNDCCCRQVLINFMATDALRLGSNTRWPRSNIELVPDNMFGKDAPFHNVDLEWNWSEVITY